MRPLVWVAVLSASFVVLTGCDPENPCEPGYYAEHGACLRIATSDDAAVDDDAGTDGPPTYNADDFGLACSTSDDCRGSAPTCGAPMFPICTAVNCMERPEVCPPSWSCLDVSSVSPDPAVTSACINF